MIATKKRKNTKPSAQVTRASLEQQLACSPLREQRNPCAPAQGYASDG